MWFKNNDVTISGNENVLNYVPYSYYDWNYPSSEHSLGLYVADLAGNLLYAQSQTFNVNFIDCGRPCDFKYNIKVDKNKVLGYLAYNIWLDIYNPYPFDLELTFAEYSMPNPNSNNGVFSPTTVVLPANSMQYFNLVYIVNNISNPVLDFYILAHSVNSQEIFSCSFNIKEDVGYLAPPRPQQDNVLSFMVYPSPAKEIVNIEYEVENPENCNLYIYNTAGQLVWNRKCQSAAERANVGISAWASGTYIVVLKHNDTIIEQKIFIKK